MFVAETTATTEDSLIDDTVSRRRVRAIPELTIVLGVYVLYKAVRFLVRDDTRSAYENARDVIGFERALGLFAEPKVQSFFLSWQPSIEALNWFYARVHLVSAAGVLLLLFFVDPETYLWLRRRLLWVTLAGLAVHLAFPLAPPRLVPMAGMVDTLQQFGPAIYSRGSALSRVANPHAAMPSLHFGFALLLALALIRSPRIPVGRWLLVHPFLMLVAIVATANHYWLDAAGCGLLIAAVEVVLRRRNVDASPDDGMLHDARTVSEPRPSSTPLEQPCPSSLPI